MKKVLTRGAWAVALAISWGITASPFSAIAEDADGSFLGLDLKGSLGKGRYTRYVPPLTNPVFNETPYITTEARAIYLYNRLPEDFVTGGGYINLAALQLRIALTERLGFIATEDGYADAHFDKVLHDEDGFSNIALGFKYAILSDPKSESLLTTGLRYEIPINDLETGGIELQGDGKGFLNPFITGATTFGDLGLQASLGANIALDGDADTSIIHYSLHTDYELLPSFFPLVELNGFTPIHHGKRLTGPLRKLDGVDLLNFGSEDRHTTITVGGGFRYQFTKSMQIGVGAETPITDNRNSILSYRLYSDLVLTW